MHRKLVVVVLSLFTGLLCSPSAWANNVTVDCSGQTPGAFSSVQAAIDSLDVVGPHTVTLLQPCTEDIKIIDHQRLTIFGANGASINGFPGVIGPVVRIQGSTGIQLVQLTVQGGFGAGIRISRNSEVRFAGGTVQNNRGQGILVEQNSTLDFTGVSQGNVFAGMWVNDSTLTVRSSQILKNGVGGVAGGVGLFRSKAVFIGAEGAPNVISGNGGGLNVQNGAAVELDAPNLIQNNESIGMSVEVGGFAEFFGGIDSNGAPLPNVISGNAFIGLNIAGGQVVLFGATQILNNGFSGDEFHAGVRSDDNGLFATGGSGDILISNNTGPGIDVTAGGTVDLTGTLVTNNSGDGIRLQGNAQVAFFPPNANVVTGNGGHAISCDGTSMFLGDRSGLTDMACTFSPFDSGTSKSRRHMILVAPQNDNN